MALNKNDVLGKKFKWDYFRKFLEPLWLDLQSKYFARGGSEIHIEDFFESAGNDVSHYATEADINNTNEQYNQGDIVVIGSSITNPEAIYINPNGGNVPASQLVQIKGSISGSLLDYYSGIPINLVSPNTTKVVFSNRIYKALRSDSGTNAPTGTSSSNIYWQYVGDAGHVIQEEGTSLTQRPNLNFEGDGVTVTDDAGNNATVVTIVSGDPNVYRLTTTAIAGNPAATYSVYYGAAPNVEPPPTGNEIFLFTPTITNAASATLTMRSTSLVIAALQYNDGTGLQNLPLNFFTVGTNYQIIWNTTSSTFEVIGSGTYIRVDDNAASFNTNTDPDLTTDQQTIEKPLTGNYANRIRSKDGAIIFRKIRKIKGRDFTYTNSAQVFANVIGSNEVNPTGNPALSNTVKPIPVIREEVPFSEVTPMTPVSNYYTTAYGGIVGQKTVNTSTTPPLKYECYEPNKWTLVNNFAADIYTPTDSSLVNIISVNNHSVAYQKVMNIVYFAGTAVITTSSTSSSFNSSLLIPTSSTVSYGTMIVNITTPNLSITPDMISVNGASGLTFTIATAGGTYTFKYSGMYIIT